MAEQPLRTNREATIRVLSPLHVGAGTGPLLQGYDFAFERGVVWVMDPRKVAERFDEETLRHGVPEVRLSRAVGPRHYADCAAYALAAPGSVAAQILPLLKDVNGAPYLPGSSLKGALRTVVGWAANREARRSLTLADLDRRAKHADDPWERKVFGREPHYDLMRGLLVDDTGPVSKEQMELVSVAVYSLRGADLAPKGQSYRFSVEALKPGTLLRCRVGIAHHLLSHPRLELSDRRQWVEGLAEPARARAAELIAAEREFYARCRLRPLQQFYERLERRAAELGPGGFLLQIAWGTGWSAKTLGRSLSEGPTFRQVRDAYGLGRPGAPFPKSRRLVERGGVPAEPPGWVEVTV